MLHELHRPVLNLDLALKWYQLYGSREEMDGTWPKLSCTPCWSKTHFSSWFYGFEMTHLCFQLIVKRRFLPFRIMLSEHPLKGHISVGLWNLMCRSCLCAHWHDIHICLCLWLSRPWCLHRFLRNLHYLLHHLTGGLYILWFNPSGFKFLLSLDMTSMSVPRLLCIGSPGFEPSQTDSLGCCTLGKSSQGGQDMELMALLIGWMKTRKDHV